MTPFQTPHTSATPRYNQNGPFVHPGVPISSSRSYRGSVSPYTQVSASPHARNYASAQESLNWQKAAEMWGAPRNKETGTPRDMGRTTPRAR